MTHNTEMNQKPQVCHYLLGARELVPFVVYKRTAVNMLKVLGTAIQEFSPSHPCSYE
jgi:hypothetical protein